MPDRISAWSEHADTDIETSAERVEWLRRLRHIHLVALGHKRDKDITQREAIEFLCCFSNGFDILCTYAGIETEYALGKFRAELLPLLTKNE